MGDRIAIGCLIVAALIVGYMLYLIMTPISPVDLTLS